MSTARRTATLALASLALHATHTSAQDTPRDSISLARLETRALQRDPRVRQLDLLATQSALRRANVDADRRPSLTLNAQGQYQSDVLTLPFQLPGGQPVPTPPHDTWDARLDIQQRIVDPTLGPRRAAEEAELDVARSRVRVGLYPLRQAVQDAFFRALRLQYQAAEIGTSITDLEASRRVAAERLRLGSALPSEVALLDAELLRRRQALAEVDAGRRAALGLLSDLSGERIPDTGALALPDLAPVTERYASGSAVPATRPEYRQFAGERSLLERQQALVSSREQPKLSAFGRVGYGRPGLNPLNDRFDRYWLAGLQVQWTPWSWGTTAREREALALQEQIVTTEEAAFTDALRRSVTESEPEIARLEATRASDDEIIALRERILAETRLRYGEGVVTSAEYVDRETDLLSARLARTEHRVQLAQARARLLIHLGLESR